MAVNGWALVDTKYVTLSPVEGEVAGWKLLDTKIVTLVPTEEEVAGWKLLDTKIVTLIPSVEEVAGWKLLDTKLVTLTLPGMPPPLTCSVDADCPPGYVCRGGVCVKKEPPVDWTMLVLLGMAVIVLAAPKEEKVGRKKR